MGTRDRIVDAALSLFAERGFDATTVADIEARAGLAPGSGGLHRYFATKEELFEASLHQRLDGLDELRDADALFPIGDLRADLTLMARVMLVETDRMRPLMRVIARDGDRFAHLIPIVRERFVQQTFASFSHTLAREVSAGRLPPVDIDAIATLLLGGIVSYRLMEVLVGEPPLRVDEDRVVGSFVDLLLGLANSPRADRPTNVEEQ